MIDTKICTDNVTSRTCFTIRESSVGNSWSQTGHKLLITEAEWGLLHEHILDSILKNAHNQKFQKQWQSKNWQGTLVPVPEETGSNAVCTDTEWLAPGNTYPSQSFHSNRINKIDLCKVKNDSVNIFLGHKSLHLFRKCCFDDYWGIFYFLIFFFRLLNIFSIYFCILCQKWDHKFFLFCFKINFIYFVCMSDVSVCMSGHHIHVVPVGARGRH